MKNDKIIFLTNDDSYLSKGFRAAVNLAREFGRVIKNLLSLQAISKNCFAGDLWNFLRKISSSFD